MVKILAKGNNKLTMAKIYNGRFDFYCCLLYINIKVLKLRNKSSLSNQNAWKALFACVEFTSNHYSLLFWLSLVFLRKEENKRKRHDFACIKIKTSSQNWSVLQSYGAVATHHPLSAFCSICWRNNVAFASIAVLSAVKRSTFKLSKTMQ